MIKVIVCGARGKMGRTVLAAVHKDPELELVGAVDITAGEDIGALIGTSSVGITVSDSLATVLETARPQVMVDFTNPQSVMMNIQTAIKFGVAPVVGTTGLSAESLNTIAKLCADNKVGALVSPNFSVGAVLMMKVSQEIAKYFPHVEIIELHHDQKLDAPSGTALRTAELITKERGIFKQGHPDEVEKLTGARGGEYSGIRIHSVRLPGYVAHQEVIFGGLGQTVTVRHDSISRESFMPGVILACKRVTNLEGLVVGLENILE